jgi:succinate dehydrogenase hydrophobic anchor subunit
MAEKVSTQPALTWFLQRISGILLAFFLLTHLNVHHLFHDITTHGIINFDAVRENLASSFWWKVYYFTFVPFVVFHAMNGFWQIIADFRVSSGLAKFIKIVFWLISIVLILTAIWTLKNLFM